VGRQTRRLDVPEEEVMRKPNEKTEKAVDRRQFLIDSGRVLLVLPAGWAVLGCSDNDSDNNNIPSTVPPTTNVTTGTLSYTSTVVAGHNHTFTLMMAEVDSPPAVGIARNTGPASTDGHVHVVVLTNAQLATIGMNGTVTMDTSVVENHSHTFTFSLAAAGVTTGAGGTGGHAGAGGAGGAAGHAGTTGTTTGGGTTSGGY
jgi:hypothetical protein